MPQCTIEQAKQISPRVLLKLINRAKEFLKRNDVFKDMCKEYDVSPDFIDKAPIRFGDIPVSARTNKGVIILNYKLLCDGNWFDDLHYLIHECEHLLQQWYGDGPTKGANQGDYLHNKYEQEGFQRQIEYLDEMYGKNEANNYTEHLLDHHDKEGKERKELKEELMANVDDK